MTANKSFPVGDTIRITAKFRVDDVLTDPTAVTLTVEDPAGTNTTPTMTKSSTGVYIGQIVPATAGYHRYKVVSTGAASGVREGTFYVATSGIV